MRAPALLVVALAALLACAVALLASRSPRLRAEVRGLLEATGLRPTWQESARYRGVVQAHRTANARLDRACFLLVGDSLSESFPGELAMPRGWAIRGISGDRVRHVRARLDASVLSAPCERVGLLVGTNDIVRDAADAEGVSRDVIALADVLAASDRQVFLHTLPPLGADRRPEGAVVAAVNARLREAAASRAGVQLVDLHAALAGPDGSLAVGLSEDGIHLTAAGYERWLAALEPALPDAAARP